MVGKWLGCIQPMCSAPGAFPPGAFFRQKSAPFPKKCLFGCFYDKTSLFIIKRPDPGGFARLRAGRIDKNEHVSIQGEALGGFWYKSKFYGPPTLST